jgi:Raf kinase inhibitor-like YbhB/YbcL family protein
LESDERVLSRFLHKYYVKSGLIFLFVFVLFFSCCAEKKIFNELEDMKLTSPAFKNNTLIPKVYTCDGEELSPPLVFDEVPANASSLALILEDPDAPYGSFIHWLVWNLPVTAAGLDENKLPEGAIQGLNTEKTNKYIGPCPPSGTHRYYFRLYALDEMLKIPASSDKKSFEAAIKAHIVAQTEYIGLYKR